MRGSSRQPLVSIGLPVYNGEAYLEPALRSLLRQTYEDFELVISDNASTDRSEVICRDYAARDPRVRYVRNATNIGGFRNHNRVVELSHGEYFTWAAHDDLRAPEHLERCVAVLRREPEVVLCYTGVVNIDMEGRALATKAVSLDAGARRPSERFRELIRMEHRIEPIYGLIRTAILRRTPLEGQYADCDRVLLAELGLHGPFYEIGETLFFRRSHPTQSVQMYPSRQSRTAWFDPARRAALVFPHFRQLGEYLRAIRRVPLTVRERVACYRAMVWWLRTYHARLRDDLLTAGKDLLRPLVPTVVRRALRSHV
jgi:glycosyltransferase involved in cell wall biosynthesis